MTETVLSGSEPAIAEQTSEVENQDVTAAPAPAVAEADESSARPKPDGLQKRFDKLTWEKHELARERDFYRQQALQNTTAKPSAAPEAPKKPPTLADFEYDEAKFAAAFAEHVKAETAREVREALRKEQAEATQRERRDTFSKREREFASKHQDYLDLAHDPSLPVSQTMADLLQEAENGPEVLYYLANNREEAARIAQMDDRSAARAFGRIESKLEKPVAPPPPPKPVSKAPPPPPQIEAVEPAVSKDPSEMTDAEFAKWRRRQIAQRRR